MWTPYVVGVAGGDPDQDPFPAGAVWPAPDPELRTSDPGARRGRCCRGPGGCRSGGYRRGAFRDHASSRWRSRPFGPRRDRRLWLTGVLGGGDGTPAKTTADKTRVGAARVATSKNGTGSATATTTPSASGPVDPATDPCGVLDPASIAKTTGLNVGAGHPVELGCAWQTTSSAGSAASLHDRQLLGGNEGVLVIVQPPNTPHPSVTCTATLPVSAPGGICTLPNSEGHYAMFQAHGSIVEVTIVSVHPDTDAQLAQLAQVAFSRSQ